MKIEKNIPVKVRSSEAGVLLKKMNVGDSILVEEGDIDRENYRRLWVRWKYRADKANIKVTIRVTDEGLRLWRLQ